MWVEICFIYSVMMSGRYKALHIMIVKILFNLLCELFMGALI